MNIENSESNTLKIPQVFFKSFTFNDGTQLNLEHNSIVVFTGANNCGKSQVLKDAENHLDASNKLPGIVIKDFETEFLGDFEIDKLIDKIFYADGQGNLQLIGTNSAIPKTQWLKMWSNHKLSYQFYKLFVKRLNTEYRLLASNPLIRSGLKGSSPIYYLNKSERLTHTISNYFRQAFGVDLVLNRNEMATIPLHVGNAPDQTAFTIAEQDEYYEKVSNLPLLDKQGDGMRSFASILLDTFTSEHNITLIDEPEAFLHPPQARVLGRMLAQNNPSDRQLLIATHSEDFLQGLLEANTPNVTVIRINRTDNINQISILKNDEIKTFWNSPLLRYSNILSGLFHEKVIVCESDYDCLFYQAIMDAIYVNTNEHKPDILFTHCGGKGRIKDVINALKVLNVPVVTICDFDVINSSDVFRPIVEAHCIKWNKLVSEGLKVIYDDANAKKSIGQNIWEFLKKTGKEGLMGEPYCGYEKLEEICKNAGLFIVPVGEMECFDKSINKEKKDWVYYVLENYNLAEEPKLNTARKFLKDILFS